MNRLLSKGMSTITIQKKWYNENLNFLSLKNLGATTQVDIIEFSNFRGLGARLYVTFLLLLFWKELWTFKVKGFMLFLNKNIKLDGIKNWISHIHF